MPDPVQTAHDAGMAAKFDYVQAEALQQATPLAMGEAPAGSPPPVAPEVKPRPEGVPEKFWDAVKGEVMTDALVKSYTELESGRKPDVPTPPVAADAAQVAVAAAKLDMAVLSQEFANTGTLSEASFQALEAAGVSKDMVDSHIAGLQALSDARDSEGFNLVGGKDQYTAMAGWAQVNMAAADLEAFNTAVTGTPAQMKQAITALKAQYTAANGSAPQLLSGENGSSGGEAAFGSRAEVTAAMRDGRYRADPAYRAMVERRIGLMETF